jgi:cytochrome P450
MQELANLDLPQIDLFDPDFSQNPHAVYAKARERSWLASYQFGYILLDQESMKDFLRDDTRCREPNRDIVAAWNAQGSPFDRFTSNQLVALSGAAHKRIRDLVAPAFTPRAANVQRELMRATLNRILDDVVPKGACEFTEVSAKYPIAVMCRLIGVPVEDIAMFAEWLEPQESAFGQDPAALPRLNAALSHLLDYVERLVADRKRPGTHPEDLLQSLVELTDQGDRLTNEELVLLVALLLGAGYDTTKNQLNLLMKLLADRPDEWERLTIDANRVKPVIEESLRYLNVIGCLHRVTNVEIVYRDVKIPANSFFSIPITFHGRDPLLNARPDEFDPDRSERRHFAFGQGMHICLGQFLARALLEEALPIIVRRLKKPRVAGPLKYRSPMGIWGYTALPITFEPGHLGAADESRR